jgi:hypothetical protein
MILRAVTANRLGDGAVVYLGPQGWTEALAGALLTEDAAPLLAQAEQPPHRVACVGPYAIEVENGEGGPCPVERKERIRAQGPTCHPQFTRRA